MSVEVEEPLFEDDPVLGTYLIHYVSNRLRLLIIGGAVLLLVWFIVTVALWQVEIGLASTLTVAALAVTTLLVGWYITHLWNREVVLYEHGFSYREGSNTAFIKYDDVTSIRQKGELLSYFGGLIRRSTLQFKITTTEDEIITLTNLYRRLDELGSQLEQKITQAMLDDAQRLLAEGESVPFGAGMSINAQGIQVDDQLLSWASFGGYHIESGHLVIIGENQNIWYRVPLAEVENIRLFIHLCRQQESRS